MSNIDGVLMLIADIYSRPNLYKSQQGLLPDGWHIEPNNKDRLEATEYTLLWQDQILAHGTRPPEGSKYTTAVYEAALMEYINA